MPSFARTSLFAAILLILTVAASARAASITGTVSDPAGRPVPRARVVLESPIGPLASALSGEDGVFELDRVAAGSYEIRVLADGFRSTPQAVSLTADGTATVNFSLELSAVSETLVVSAAQVEAPRSSAPAAVTVITGAELRAQQVETLADAIRAVPGQTVVRSGGRGALTSLFPRGGESDYTLVAADGVRLNSFGGGFDFSNLAVEGVERVEIVRGPQSALFGGDAIGGVVQIVNRRGAPLRASALVEGGGFGTVRAAAAASGGTSRWSWGGAIDRPQSDGFRGTAANGEQVTNDDWEAWTTTFNLGVDAPNWNARGHGQFSGSDRGNPGPYGSDPNGTYFGVDRVARSIIGTNAGDVSASWLAGEGFRLRGQTSFADLDGRFPGSFGESLSESNRTTGRVAADVAFAPGWSATGGIEALAESGGSTYIVGLQGTPIPVERNLVGFFGEARFEPSTRLLITAGLRVERIHRDALENDPNSFSPRPPLAADTEVSTNPRVAASWFAVAPGTASARWTRLRGSAGTGIRPPDAFEMAFTDNPSLQPERSKSYDIGVEQAFLGGQLIADAAWFANNYDDLIITVGGSFTDASRYRTDNISNARARGLETSLMARFGGVRVGASYTYLDTEILSVDGSGSAPPPYAPGDQLLRRPRHQGGADVAVVQPRWNAFARLGARGRAFDVDPSFGPSGGLLFTPGYTVVDFGAALTLWRELDVFVRALNGFDRRYEEAAGYPALGRHAIVGVRIAGGR